MRAALAVALLAPRPADTYQASAPAGYTEQLVTQGTGLLITPTAAQVLKLATDYLTNYPQFLVDAQELVAPAIYAAENAQNEQTPMQLVLRGLSDPPFVGSQAGRLADALNQAAAQGKLLNTDQTPIQPWTPGAPVAYADDSTATLTVQWIKGQPWAWVIVGVALAILGVVLYYLLQKSPYAMSAFVKSGGQAILTAGSWLLSHWGWVLLGLGVAVITPYGIRLVARTREAGSELRYAERGGF